MTVLEFDLRFDITAWGRSLPGLPVDNLAILSAQEKFLKKKRMMHPLLDLAIQKRFGYKHRHWVRTPWENLSSKQKNSEDLAYEACLQLNLSKSPSCFLYGTTTSTRYTSSQATAIAGRLGWRLPALELKAGCSTSLVTLMNAFFHMSAGCEDAVISCSETLSKVLSKKNLDTWFGLSDAGAALHIKKTTHGPFKLKKTYFKSFGEYVDLFTTRGYLPPTIPELEEDLYTMSGDADKMKNLAYEHYGLMLREFLPTQEERESIDWIIPHQVNKQLIVNLQKELGISGNYMWISDRFGNPGGTAVLLALVTALEEGFFSHPGRILLMSVGGGLSSACQLIEFNMA